MSFAGHPTIGTAIYLSKCKEQGEFEGIEKLRTVAGVVPFDFTSPSTSSQSKSLGTAEVAVRIAPFSAPAFGIARMLCRYFRAARGRYINRARDAVEVISLRKEDGSDT